MNDAEFQIEALKFARQNKNWIAKKLTDLVRYPADKSPISMFMAGSPGAGKTELSKSLLQEFEKESAMRNVIRIDGDELREYFPDYTGKNSSLFQSSISIIIDKIHDLVLDQKQTFILDGTLADYSKAIKNINRSLSKKRRVFIFYVYQEPQVAWKFTLAREKDEGRNIPKSAFIDGFVRSRETVEQIRHEFGDEVTIFLIKKDFEKNIVNVIVEIKQDGKQIDYYLSTRYSKDELGKLL